MRRIRSLLRPFAGRETALWRRLRAPRLRYVLFRDVIDCVIYGLLASKPDVRFVQIGSNDGVTGDPLWTFRAWPGWSGILVEPVPHVFRRLAHNYRHWPGRFVLVNAAVAPEAGIRPFHYFAPTPELPPTCDQLGSLDAELLDGYSRHFPDAHLVVVSDPVTCMTFDALCAAHGLRTPDLLHIDAEGADGRILACIDFDRYDPAVLLYEHSNLRDDERAATTRVIRDAGFHTLVVGRDTLCVRERALAAFPPLASAWRTVAQRP